MTTDHDEIADIIARATDVASDPDVADTTACTDPAAVARVAEALEGLPLTLPDSAMPSDVAALAGRALAVLRLLPEVQRQTCGLPLEVRWTRKALLDRIDGSPIAARPPTVVSVADRACWPGDEPAPAWRLTLSIPWMLLAYDHDIERALYEALAWCGVRDPDASVLVPCLVRPDVVAHGSALRRYGLGTRHQADALVGASAHPSTPARLAEWHIDASGQGALWAPVERAS